MPERPSLVVDASVAVKWFLPEPGHHTATRLQDLYLEERLDLYAPHLLISECGNVFWRRSRRGDFAPAVAERCFEALLVTAPILLDSPLVSRAAMQLALAHGQTVYDCLYLAWALEQRCDLITADQKFYRSMHRAFPAVRHLDNF